jgi:hypothetical protein
VSLALVFCNDLKIWNVDSNSLSGYKSRVRFYSVLDPTQTCSYISEVLDAEVKQPLFKVIHVLSSFVYNS